MKEFYAPPLDQYREMCEQKVVEGVLPRMKRWRSLSKLPGGSALVVDGAASRPQLRLQVRKKMNNLRTTSTTAKATVWTLTPCKHTHPRGDPGTPTPTEKNQRRSLGPQRAVSALRSGGGGARVSIQRNKPRAAG